MGTSIRPRSLWQSAGFFLEMIRIGLLFCVGAFLGYIIVAELVIIVTESFNLFAWDMTWPLTFQNTAEVMNKASVLGLLGGLFGALGLVAYKYRRVKH